VRLYKLIVAQLIKKFSTFYRTQNSLFMNMTAFWDIAPCNFILVYRRFRRQYAPLKRLIQ
jgi:hypothetical protein